MNGDRIKSDHSEIQLPVKKALDVVKTTVRQTTERSNLSGDDINRINQYISEFQDKIASHEYKLIGIQNSLQTSCDQLKEQMKQHQAVYKESDQMLRCYEAHRLFDLQKFKQEHSDKINDKVNPLLAKFHSVEQEIIDLTKEQDKHGQETQKEQGKLLNCSSLSDEGEERLKDLTTKLSSLREQMRKASLTPTDKLFGQLKKHKLACEKVKAICDNVEKELTKYSLGITPGAQKSGEALLPEVTQIDQLLSEVKQIQKLVDESSRCPRELQEKVKPLTEKIEQLHQKATATQQLYEQIKKTDTEKLHQEQVKFNKLADRIWHYTCPEKYNPYYPIDRVYSKKSLHIDNTLSGPCAIMTIRRGLSILGINIRRVATEKNVAQLVEYLDTERGTLNYNIQNVYQHYGFDYRYYDGLVTIDEIEQITQKHHVVNIGVYKPGLGAHSLLIEKVTKTNDSYCVNFYDPHGETIVVLPYEELEKVLTGKYTLPSKRQRETREPILNAQAQEKAKMKMLWSILDCLGARSTGRS
jgi:uncharacterized coiled-coil DUF342 family protein